MFRKVWSDDKWLLISQVEHARVAGLMAAAWDFGGRRAPQELLTAVSRHDDGWKPVDEAPEVNAQGDPRAFNEMPAEVALEIWSRSAGALAQEEKHYAAGLVAGHFIHLARNNIHMANLSPRQAVAVGRFIGQQQPLAKRAQQLSGAKANSAIGMDDVMVAPSAPKERNKHLPQDYDKDLRLLQVCDYLSVLLCTDFSGEVEIENVPYLPQETTIKVQREAGKLALTLSPVPFRKNLRDHIGALLLPRRVYASAEELQAAMKGEKALSLEFHIGNPEGKSSAVYSS